MTRKELLNHKINQLYNRNTENVNLIIELIKLMPKGVIPKHEDIANHSD